MTTWIKPVDKRVKRSQRLLQDALLTLLETKPFQKINISEITNLAGVARTTFYAHFNSKENLLLSCIDNIFDAFFEQLRERDLYLGKRDPIHQIPLLLAQEWKKNREILERIRSANVDFLILTRIREIISLYYSEESRLVIGTSPNSILEKYLQAYVAAATHAILIQWTDNGMKETPEAIAILMIKLYQKEILDNIRQNLDPTLFQS